MAILKMVNYKNSGAKRLREALEYCLNPTKMDNDVVSYAITDDPFTAFHLNRKLHGKERRHRWFKVAILSMEKMWGSTITVEKMTQLAQRFSDLLANDGYQCIIAIHTNTPHPHFHCLIDTCNVITGKQLSQSLKDLANLKEDVNYLLDALDLGEIIGEKLEELTVEEDFAFEFEEESEDCEDEYNDDFDWEPNEEYPEAENDDYETTFEEDHPRRLIATLVDKEPKKLIATLVDKNETKKRRIAVLVDSDKKPRLLAVRVR